MLKNSDNLLTPFWVFHILYPPPHEHQFSWNPTRPPPKGWANVPSTKIIPNLDKCFNHSFTTCPGPPPLHAWVGSSGEQTIQKCQQEKMDHFEVKDKSGSDNDERGLKEEFFPSLSLLHHSPLLRKRGEQLL